MSLEHKKKNTSSLLSQWKKRKKATTDSMLSPRPKEEKAFPSKGQRRLWLLQELYPENSFYQYGHLYTVQGALDLEVLNQSFQLLIQRHEILRTNFIKKDADLFLNINPDVNFSCSVFDLEHFSSKEQEEKSKEYIHQESKKTFDLAEDLLLRVSVLRFSKNKFQIILSMHHIIGDRWSLRLLNEELFRFYKKIKSQERVHDDPLTIQYADYAYWQQGQQTKAEDLKYWMDKLAGELPVLNIPGDYKRPQRPSFKGANISIKLDTDLSKRLQQMAKDHEVTMFALMLSAFKVLLYRYTNQTDIIIGSPFSNRDKPALEKLIGFFNETLVLRTQVENDWTFKQLIADVKNTRLKAFVHKNVPFDELVRALQVERHGSANPVFQAMFLYNSILPFSIPDLDLKIKEEMIDLEVSKFDLTLFVNDHKAQLELSLEFSLDLFKPETANRLLQHFEVLLQSVVEDSNISIDEIPLLDPKESKQILLDWNNTALDYPEYSSIHQMIEEQAQLNPEKIAVVFQNNELTYAKLNTQANVIAANLIEAGIKPNQSVGLFSNRSVELMASILGILKAGAAYLPLDPEYPLERIEFMIQDSGTTMILSQKTLVKKLKTQKANIFSIEDLIQQGIPENWGSQKGNLEHLAYIIYTSGSTGKPKGVPIRHENLLHSTLSRYTFYPSNPEAFLLLSSFSFDSSVVGIFWTLCSGGTLVLPPKRIEQDVIQLSEIIARYKISHTLMLPSLYSAVLNHAPIEQIRTLKNVMVAGEACPFTLIDKHYDRLPNTDLYNEYGPTEASVWCIAHQILPNEKDFVPIGKAIPNTEVYILNSALQACPIGIPGELYIGGLGVAEGYLNRPDLTDERFIKHPFKRGQMVYKTGDVARFHSDGRIEFLGRVDHQVKIRGFRVEPDEIQKRILEYGQVKEALVIVDQSARENQNRLIAYVSGVLAAAIPDLRQYLEKHLPAYMVPAVFIDLEEFPRLPNGKVNRKGLPDPGLFSVTKECFIAPQSAVEIQLASIWAAVLKLESVGIRDNFFSLGGDSILSIQVVSKARDLGIILAPNQLFEHQTIEALANSVEGNERSDFKNNSSDLLENNPRSYSLSALQKAFLFNSESNGTDQGLLQLEFTIVGNIDIDRFKQAWQQSIERHDAMRTFIQYPKGQQAIQVIAPEVYLKWEILDWQNLSENEQVDALKRLRLNDQQKSLDLKTAPVSRMYFIRTASDKQLLFWTCHHIFLDGWSCGIILKDALRYYHSIQKQDALDLPALPNFLAYLQWKRTTDFKSGQEFWRNTLDGFKKPLTFKITSNKVESFEDEFLKLSKQESLVLKTFSQKNNISLSTLFQGLWALLIGELFNQSDVVYGLTVSGRFSDFPQIESTSGLFMNVIPNRFKIKKEQSFSNWLKDLQRAQGKIRQFESIALEEIKSMINWPNHVALFDSLFVFGNFLKDGLKVGGLEVEHFQGGFTSSYPLTIRVNPLSQIELDWRYDVSRISQKKMEWIKNAFHDLLKLVNDLTADKSLMRIVNQLETWDGNNELDLEIEERQRSPLPKVLPRNQTELDLSTIWKKIFNQDDIGVRDDFFDLGGKSLMAIQLFSEIERALDFILPPSILFEKSTIESLAKVIDEDSSNVQENQILISLRSSGTKPPLFCIHGGGAHVFFYKKMADYLPEDQPVYSFQPPGLNGGKDFPKTIEEMASQYISTLKTIQAKGPYQLLGTCFSNAVVLEMTHQLKRQGEHVEKLFIIDSAPVHLFGNDQNGKNKTFSRFVDLLKRGDLNRIQSKIKSRFLKNKNASLVAVEHKSNSEKQLAETILLLNKLYANYHWKALEGSIYFIRSTEFNERLDKKYHLTQWNKLARGGVQLEIVTGHHTTLFEDPEVEGLAKKINQCLITK